MFDTAIELFKEYSGSGLMMTLFLVSLLYLWVTEKEKHIKQVLIYVSALALVVFFCPLFTWIVIKFADDEIYYRVLWLLPIGITVSYAMVRFMRTIDGWKKWVIMCIFAITLVLSGKYVYENEYFGAAKNAAHVPDYVVDICDYIIVPGREVRAAFPAIFLPYVRQYTSLVHMPYGREMFMENDEYYNVNALYGLMEAEVIDAKALSDELRLQDCHYVILEEKHAVKGDLEELNWKCLDIVDGYKIYIDLLNDPR